MEKSFKQIISTFETFATKHKVIKQFKADPITSFVAKNNKYPLQWVELRGSTLSPGEVIIDLTIYFVVLLNPNNYIKIMSDSLRLCTDFYSYFHNNLSEFGFLFIGSSTSATPVEYQFDDKVCGHKMDISIKIPFERDERKIPI